MSTSSDSQPTAPKRELAAIMFSDIAGYTAIMGRDEHQAMHALAAHRELLRSLLPRFNGRLIGEIGDGTLSSFQSAVDAVSCAREIQTVPRNHSDLHLRIGIHIGDVVFTHNTVLGDGVNVASRIHGLAPPGGICISANVYDEIRNKPGIRAKDLGKKKLKNVSRPIRVYALALTPAVERPKRKPVSMRWAAIAAGVGALALAAVVYGVSRWRSLMWGLEGQPAVEKRAIRSIAVLPLNNFSGDPNQEYFADGMTEELTADLAKISALRVISRTSVMQFQGENRKSVSEIARELNVDAVVEGSVLRIGDKVRITAQLIDALADKHLWAQSYERDSRDVLALQDEVASAIARQINIELTSDEQARLASARPVNQQAYDALLKGMYYLRKHTPEGDTEAGEYFNQAIKIDPKFAKAYAALAGFYVVEVAGSLSLSPREVMPKAREAAEKALELDDTLADAHVVVGRIKFSYDFDWPGGEAELQRAIALDPNSALAHSWYGWLLTMEGRFDQGEAEFERASELDPLHLSFILNVGLPPMFQGQFEKATEQVRKVLAMDPSFGFAYFDLGRIDIASGKPAEAIVDLGKTGTLRTWSTLMGSLGYAYAASGKRQEAEKLIDELSHRPYPPPDTIAIIYLGLGDKDRALEWLGKAYQDRSYNLIFLKVDHSWDPLRLNPRFIELLKKVGLEK
jgi:TolB-like protein/class 3 adenylate cyclase